MGSIDKTTKEIGDDGEEVTVLVTGFGPFKTNHPVNPSWEIAASLPQYLPWDRVKDPAHRTSARMPRVRLRLHPEPVRVSYMTVRDLVPTLWDGDDDHNVDLALHIGMAGAQVQYCVERRAHRDGYAHKDVDGEVLGDEARRADEGGDWIWDGLPEELLSNLDVDDVYERWAKRCPDKGESGPIARISEDPGRYLCDFIYYSSQAHLTKTHRPRNVLFLHVPSDASAEAVKRGVEYTTQLIRSMVESEVERRAAGGKAQ